MPKSARPLWYKILGHTNVTITACTAAFILYTRSAAAVYFGVGALGTTVLAKAVKRLLRIPRPPQEGRKKTSYGMPSTHSATAAFYATYLALACIYLPIHKRLPQNDALRYLTPVFFLPWAYVIAKSRIWMGRHTVAQVLVGLAMGSVLAVGWFRSWTSGFNEQGQMLEDLFEPYVAQLMTVRKYNSVL